MGQELVQESTPIQNNPLAIIAQAVEKGLDADHLEKLVNLHERIERMTAARAYQEAMCRCQAEMPNIIKGRENKQTRSRYVDLGALIHQIKPIYTMHGFSLTFHQEDCKKDGWMRMVCDVMHRAGHRESKWLELPIDGVGAKGNAIGAMNPVQGVGSSTTYAERYLICKIFNLPVSDEDLDGNIPEPTLNEDQIDMLLGLIEATGTDKAKFLAWAQVDRIADIPQKLFVAGRDMLQRKLKKEQADADN